VAIPLAKGHHVASAAGGQRTGLPRALGCRCTGLLVHWAADALGCSCTGLLGPRDDHDS
jgi:hypothetical protein